MTSESAMPNKDGLQENTEPMRWPVGLPEVTCRVEQTQRVQVPNNLVLGCWVIGMIVQVLGKYVIIRYLDPWRI